MLSHVNGLTSNEYINSLLISGYVSMFFVLSGLTFNIHSNIKSSIIKKLKRLLIPYFFYGITITFFTDILAHRGLKYEHYIGILYSRNQIFVNDEHSEYGLSVGCLPIWFLTALFVSYLLVYLWLKHENLHKLLCYMYILLAIVMSYLPILLPWSIDVAPIGAVLIILGINYKKAFLNKQDPWIYFILFLSYPLIVYINGHTNMSIRYYGDIEIVNIILFCYLAMMESLIICMFFKWTNLYKPFNLIQNIFAYIGKHSLRLMCIHLFFWIKLSPLLPIHNNILNIISVFAIIILINHIIFEFCNRFKTKFHILKYL